MSADNLLHCNVLFFLLALASGFIINTSNQDVKEARISNRNPLLMSSLHATTRTTTKTSSEAFVPTRLSRKKGLSLLDDVILPQQQYGERIEFGRDAQGLDGSTLVLGSDPLMSFTYGEFPTPSTDQLVDRALQYIQQDDNAPSLNFIDLGSGCGRLVFYTALTRGDSQRPWHVHGIEISDILHKVATERGLQSGLQAGHFFPTTTTENNPLTDNAATCDMNTLSLHLGPADKFSDLLGKAHIIFAYSTTWETSGFSGELGAMILDHSWNELLAQSCSKGCIVITTDRALDPSYGWELLCPSLEVENREVAGSMGYIQVLR